MGKKGKPPLDLTPSERNERKRNQSRVRRARHHESHKNEPQYLEKNRRRNNEANATKRLQLTESSLFSPVKSQPPKNQANRSESPNETNRNLPDLNDMFSPVKVPACTEANTDRVAGVGPSTDHLVRNVDEDIDEECSMESGEIRSNDSEVVDNEVVVIDPDTPGLIDEVHAKNEQEAVVTAESESDSSNNQDDDDDGVVFKTEEDEDQHESDHKRSRGYDIASRDPKRQRLLQTKEDPYESTNCGPTRGEIAFYENSDVVWTKLWSRSFLDNAPPEYDVEYILVAKGNTRTTYSLHLCCWEINRVGDIAVFD